MNEENKDAVENEEVKPAEVAPEATEKPTTCSLKFLGAW